MSRMNEDPLTAFLRHLAETPEPVPFDEPDEDEGGLVFEDIWRALLCDESDDSEE